MLNRNKIKNISVAGLIFFVLLVLTGAVQGANQDAGQPSSQPADFSQEELANVAKPSVVRIIQQIKGTMTVYPFDIDLKGMKIFPLKKGQPAVLEIDETLTGSGMIVSPDGYILTNSHVVSYHTAKLEKAAQLVAQMILEKAMLLSEEESKSIGKDEKVLTDFGKSAVEFIIENSKYELAKTITVLNPYSTKQNTQDLVQDGFPASIVSVNDNFYKDNRDVALVKIKENNLPSIGIGKPDALQIGQKIFIFGFPSSADLNRESLMESTFTSGSISAFKDSDNKEFKLIQTDAKISHGSSGGPLLNGQGEIAGLVTYLNNDDSENSGDSFAFAVPISIVRETIEKNYISDLRPEFKASSFVQHYMSGIRFAAAGECRGALGEFQKARDVNPKFNNNQNLQKDTDKCQSVISAGQSLDSDWEKFRKRFFETDMVVWIISFLGLIVSLALIFIISHLSKKLKKDEKEIGVLEKQLGEEEMEIDDLGKLLKDENGLAESANNAKPAAGSAASVQTGETPTLGDTMPQSGGLRVSVKDRNSEPRENLKIQLPVVKKEEPAGGKITFIN